MIRPLKQLLLIPAFMIACVVSAQNIPGGISYQAVARDPDGLEIKSKPISVRLSLLTGSPSGSPEWVETHAVTTDAYGLFNLIFGEGSREGGSSPYFSTINWGSGNHFLKVEVDFGTGYRYMGTSPFMAVPYALFAQTAGQVQNLLDPDSTNELISSIELQGNNLVIREGGKTKTVDLSHFYDEGSDDQQLAFNQQTGTLSLENGGSVNLSSITGGSDKDSTNELISSISLNGSNLEIHEGSHVKQISLASLLDNTDNQDLQFDPVNQHLSIENGSTLVDLKEIIMEYDGSSTNEIQRLTKVGSVITLDKNGGSIIDADSDSTNELQTLGLNGNVLNISDGNSVTFNFDDADANPTNEIQHLTKVGNVISLDKSGGSIIVADGDSTNELQTLGLSGNVLSLSKGNSVTFNFDDADANTSNEIQDLSLSSNLLTLSKDPTPAAVDLSPYLDNTDNQTLSVDVPNNKLSISLKPSGTSTVNIDADPSNEIQDLQLTGNALKITKNAGASTINLAPFLDNTDAQSLSFSNGNLTISNGNSVSIRESIIAFRVLKTSINLISHPDSTLLYFNQEGLDTQNAYDPSSGSFTVPAGGDGIYSFTVSYAYASTQILRIIKNDLIFETLQPFDNYSFMLSLAAGDRIGIRLVNPSTSTTFNNSIGSFMGYRVNQ
ncbi:MAG: hypothetical protein U0T82_08635 [Bacteroidales bacterium]